MRRARERRRADVGRSDVRERLIEAASQIFREEGMSALTGRRVAESVGLKRQVVHYYFGSVEELIVAILQREEVLTRRKYEDALKCKDPLRAIRYIGVDASVMVHEFAVLAFRYDSIRKQYVKSVQEFRRLYIDSLARYLELCGLKSNIPLAVVATMMQVVSQAQASESALGAVEGRELVDAFIDDWLNSFAGRGVSPSIHD